MNPYFSRNRTRVSGSSASTRVTVAETLVGTGDHVVPPFRRNCHAPARWSIAVIARPGGSPSTSVTPPRRTAMGAPAGLVGAGVRENAGSIGIRAVLIAGASGTGFTITVNVRDSVSTPPKAVPPSPASVRSTCRRSGRPGKRSHELTSGCGVVALPHATNRSQKSGESPPREQPVAMPSTAGYARPPCPT
jgi:hypothetical protein